MLCKAEYLNLYSFEYYEDGEMYPIAIKKGNEIYYAIYPEYNASPWTGDLELHGLQSRENLRCDRLCKRCYIRHCNWFYRNFFISYLSWE
jgi:hypothetical protein